MATRTLPRYTDPRGPRPDVRRQAAESMAREAYPHADRVEAHFDGRDLYVEVWTGKVASLVAMTGEVDG